MIRFSATGPAKRPFRGVHYSNSDLPDGVIHGGRRGSSPESSDAHRLHVPPGAPPAVHAYEDDATGHPAITGRKFAHRISGNKAIATIEDSPTWADALKSGHAQALAAGADPQTAQASGINTAERALVSKGYDGYRSKKHPGQVVLFGDQKIGDQSSSTPIYFARHAKTAANAPGAKEVVRAWGDPPPDEVGIKEAQKVAEVMKHTGIRHVISSDLQRAQIVGQAAAQATGSTYAATPLLRSWNLGELTGRKVDDVKPQLDYFQKNPNAVVPGGESFNQFLHRFSSTFKAIYDQAQKSGEPVLIVGHGRHYQVLPHILSGGMVGVPNGKGNPAYHETPGTVAQISRSDSGKLEMKKIYEPDVASGSSKGS